MHLFQTKYVGNIFFVLRQRHCIFLKHNSSWYPNGYSMFYVSCCSIIATARRYSYPYYNIINVNIGIHVARGMEQILIEGLRGLGMVGEN